MREDRINDVSDKNELASLIVDENRQSLLSKRKPSTLVHSLYNNMKPTPFDHLIAKKGSDAALHRP